MSVLNFLFLWQTWVIVFSLRSDHTLEKLPAPFCLVANLSSIFCNSLTYKLVITNASMRQPSVSHLFVWASPTMTQLNFSNSIFSNSLTNKYSWLSSLIVRTFQVPLRSACFGHSVYCLRRKTTQALCPSVWTSVPSPQLCLQDFQVSCCCA